MLDCKHLSMVHRSLRQLWNNLDSFFKRALYRGGPAVTKTGYQVNYSNVYNLIIFVYIIDIYEIKLCACSHISPSIL